jgi:hypothetical protein
MTWDPRSSYLAFLRACDLPIGDPDLEEAVDAAERLEVERLLLKLSVQLIAVDLRRASLALRGGR